MKPAYLKDLESCQLCEWRCKVNRLKGEVGVCRIGLPTVASLQFHPAPPASYDIFFAGCNFKCLGCQNWTIAYYPDNKAEHEILGFLEPQALARKCVDALHSSTARMIGATCLFFTGGEPTVHLPYVEKIVKECRKLDPDMRFNYDTNGFLTPESLKRVATITTTFTYDIKAFNDETYRALTGAPAKPVFRNAEYLIKNAPEKIYEIRVLVIPELMEETEQIARFIAELNPAIPVCFLAFRPNFVLEKHFGPSEDLLNASVSKAQKLGLKTVHWSGIPGIAGKIPKKVKEAVDKLKQKYKLENARLAGAYAAVHGCVTHPRDCGSCKFKHKCVLKKYQASRLT